MLRSITDLAGLSLHATDGDIGSLTDVYFDDNHWRVRYFVVDTGNWLPGRLVLISPASVANVEVGQRQLNVTLTKGQVEKSPGIEAHETVSRQHEQHMSKYYGWPVYWPVEGAAHPSPRIRSRGMRTYARRRGQGISCTRQGWRPGTRGRLSC